MTIHCSVDDLAHLLEEDLGGECGHDSGEDGAHGAVGDSVAVRGHLDGHAVEVLEHLDPPRVRQDRLEKEEFKLIG